MGNQPTNKAVRPAVEIYRVELTLTLPGGHLMGDASPEEIQALLSGVHLIQQMDYDVAQYATALNVSVISSELVAEVSSKAALAHHEKEEALAAERERHQQELAAVEQKLAAMQEVVNEVGHGMEEFISNVTWEQDNPELDEWADRLMSWADREHPGLRDIKTPAVLVDRGPQYSGPGSAAWAAKNSALKGALDQGGGYPWWNGSDIPTEPNWWVLVQPEMRGPIWVGPFRKKNEAIAAMDEDNHVRALCEGLSVNGNMDVDRRRFSKGDLYPVIRSAWDNTCACHICQVLVEVHRREQVSK